MGGELSLFWLLSALRALELEAGSRKDLLLDREVVALPARYFDEELPLVWPWLGRLANMIEQLAGDGCLDFSMSADNVAKKKVDRYQIRSLLHMITRSNVQYPYLPLASSQRQQTRGTKQGRSILWRQGGLTVGLNSHRRGFNEKKGGLRVLPRRLRACR